MAVYGKNTVSGKWRPRNLEKYVGNVDEIFLRSSWEFKFCNFCDNNPDVLEWSSEEVVIPYFCPIKGKMRRYFVDFWAMIRDSRTGKVGKYLIEIKPDKFTRPPATPKKKTKRYIEELAQYANNSAKWEAVREACRGSDVQFVILTENDLGIHK